MDRNFVRSALSMPRADKEKAINILEQQALFLRSHINDVEIVKEGNKWQLKNWELALLNYMIMKFNSGRGSIDKSVLDENFEQDTIAWLNRLVKLELLVKENNRYILNKGKFTP